MNETDVEFAEFLQDGPGVIGLGARIQDSQDATAEQRVEPTLALRAQLLRFHLGKDFKAAFRPYLGVDRLLTNGAEQGSGAFHILLQG